jgi:hypothetical protein
MPSVIGVDDIVRAVPDGGEQVRSDAMRGIPVRAELPDAGEHFLHNVVRGVFVARASIGEPCEWSEIRSDELGEECLVGLVNGGDVRAIGTRLAT